MVAPYGRKRIARRQKKSKKKKQKNSGGVITPTEQEYHSCELKAFVEYQIRLFKEYLLEKYNQVNGMDTFILTSLAPISLFFPCKEGADESS